MVFQQAAKWATEGVTRISPLPKHLDEKVALLHLVKYGVNLTALSAEQSAYIGVTVDGPYKPEHYRY